MLKDKSPKVFCLPSGMLSSGYSCYAATQILPHSNNMIMFCGYSAEGTLARKIKDKKTKTISIDNKSYNARCQVITLKSFSSHTQYNDLLNVYSGKDGHCYDKIVLIHSNQKDKIDFAYKLQEECAKHNHNTKIVAANSSTCINL